MLADVTNVSRGARGFHLADGATHVIEPGASARLDLADHPAHDAWAAAGDVVIAVVSAEASPSPAARGKATRRSRA